MCCACMAEYGGVPTTVWSEPDTYTPARQAKMGTRAFTAGAPVDLPVLLRGGL
jgi:hypothetical protein